MIQDSFIDISRPSAGRIYDYLLGGSHNFEVDRQAADQVVTYFPFLPKAMRLQRWSLQDLALNLTQKRGFDTLIDFGSGLPTMEHLHSSVASGTTIIYSESDPIVVEYAHEILKAVPDVYKFRFFSLSGTQKQISALSLLFYLNYQWSSVSTPPTFLLFYRIR